MLYADFMVWSRKSWPSWPEVIDKVGFSLFRFFTLIVFWVARVGIKVVSDVMINRIPTRSHQLNRS